ncbi:BT4734/BF3469 family protein [Dyadobacter crusticola]|uniref:BT4734/BF3469 family protein n=1 Tax=Dyadobacter crusticola TaxID=292407 RepID=UPI00068C730E|nr:BT4734/BF3469 family protein [Dyadobacter crusticola]
MNESTKNSPQSEFSFFKGGAKVTKPSAKTTLAEVIDWIRDGRYAEAVKAVQSAGNDKEKSFHKKRLDFVTFSGIFPVRAAANLEKHSGLIVIDFDKLQDAQALKMHLVADPYVAACFISPSGAGVKAVIRIEQTEKHKEVFADLAHYFNNVYRLPDNEKVDPSGSDVSRPCFLSWDPDAFYRGESKVYKIQNQIPPKPKTEHQIRQDATDVEKHVAAVVERIEADKMDICNEYGTEWLLIAFSMATLGENGRSYFHRISAQNAKYSEKDADEKFDNALQTTRFTTAAKFFSICKDYGLDVSRPKAEKQAKAKDLTKQEIAVLAQINRDVQEAEAKLEKKKKKKTQADYEDDADEDKIPFTVWYTKTGGMKIRGGRYFDHVAQNFQVYIKYRTEDEQENVTWVLEIRKADGNSEYIEVIHDDFCSARKLKSMLATRRLGFKIKDNHLDELHSYLFTQTEFSSAIKVVRYGYHPDSKVYFFANKALNLVTNELLTPDEFGIVEANKKHLSAPQPPKARQLRHTLTNQNVTFGDFWKLYAMAHLPENGFVPVCFYIFSLFRDMGLQYKNFSPILFLKGGAGTGKSSMVRILTAGFGRKQEGVNLKSKNTDASLVKLMSQSSNQIIWFDEFHNELTNEGLLQAAYDNDGYHKSTTDFNSIDTAAVEIHSALALTSNYIPENPIFFSRCVFIPITAQQKTDAQRKAYDQLESIQEAGLGCMTVELLKYRGLLEANDNYAFSYNRLYNSLKTRFKGQNIPERLFANMSQILAAPFALHCLGKINMLSIQTEDEADILAEFVEVAENFIMRQFRIQNDSKAVAEFFEIIQGLFEANQIHEGFHFRFVGNGEIIQIHFRKLYNLFAQKYRQIFFKSPPDRDTIQSELTTLSGQTEWEAISKTVRFLTEADSNSKSLTMPQTGSCELNYKQLQQNFGIDLVNRQGNIH